MQKIILEIADVVLASAITALTHLQTQFPNNAEIQRDVKAALPVLQSLTSVVSGLNAQP